MSVQRIASADLPTRDGGFTIHIYEDNGKEHVALTLGTLETPAIVRIHSECLTGDVFGSSRCDCGEQLEASIRYLEDAGSGVLLYLRQEGRGIGLANKIRAYALQDAGLDTVDANLALGLPEDARDYRCAAQMLLDLGVDSVRLLTNNPAKVAGLQVNGVEVFERIPMEIAPNAVNLAYLRTKHDRMGHLLSALETER